MPQETEGLTFPPFSFFPFFPFFRKYSYEDQKYTGGCKKREKREKGNIWEKPLIIISELI
jgi:hypothetical protein